MCCKTKVFPLNIEIAETLLLIGKFEKTYDGSWARYVGSEGAKITVSFVKNPNENYVMLSLTPSVSSMDGHSHKRNAAGIMYEIAAKYAERIGGSIYQTGINVMECKLQGTQERLLASYPSKRLDYSLLCPGFQKVFLEEE